MYNYNTYACRGLEAKSRGEGDEGDEEHGERIGDCDSPGFRTSSKDLYTSYIYYMDLKQEVAHR
jgi:hypothetical protein